MRKFLFASNRFVSAVSLLLVYGLIVSSAAIIPITARAATTTKRTKSAPRKVRLQKKKGGRRQDELIVRFKPNTLERDIDFMLAGRGAYRGKRLRGTSRLNKVMLAGRDPEALALELASNPAVEWVEPNYTITKDDLTPDDPRFSEQWALHNSSVAGSDINVMPAWDTTTGSNTTVIAVIDSGIDFTHLDLAGNQWVNTLEAPNGRDDDKNGLIDDIHGWDWVNSANDSDDEMGHGTAIAGIIAAQGNNGIGTSGVMWRASLMSLKVLDKTGSGNISDAVEAIDYAIAHGAQIINCSWGSDEESQALREAILRAESHGILVVVSAGNDGRNLDQTPYYPASYGLANTIAVAGTDSQDRLAPWSNYSSSQIGIAAPGSNILTTKKGGDYQTINGTSAAAPFVTGVAGLIKTKYPQITAIGLRAAIIQSARQISGLHNKVSSGGIVDATKALGVTVTLPPTFWPNGGNPGGATGPDGTPGSGGTGGGENPGGGQNPGDTGPDGSPLTLGQRGAPGSNLPNLDEARRLRSSDRREKGKIHANTCFPDDPDYPNCGGGGGGNESPVADPGGPYSAGVGVSIFFYGLASYDSDGWISSWGWDFGDGHTSPAGTGYHSYSSAGTYTATLTVYDNLGSSDSATVSVTISNSNQAPVARPGGPYSANTSSSVSFSGSTSSDPDGSIASYSWNFGDGYTGTGATPFHTYSVASVFTVSLTVTDNNGATNTATTTATISTITNHPPVSNPGGPYSQQVSNSISFDGHASSDSDGTISTYSWNFGDSGTATGVTPTHTYTTAGTYTVSLTVTDNGGLSSTATTIASIGNGTNIYTMLFDPSNATGTGGEDVFSGNFNWQLPLLGLSGRAGLDLGIGLSYNSHVWTKEGSAIGFDLDQGSPSPGFRLGFPTIMSGYNTNLSQTTYLMVASSGARIEFRPTGTTGLYETADSSHTQLTVNSSTSITVRGTDGTQLSYSQTSTNPLVFKCTNITDRNGNSITVTYTGNNINQITDSVGRVVTFNYDSASRVTSITQPWGGSTHTWARFSYANLVIQTSFPGLTLVGVGNGSTISVLSQVGLGASGDGSVFNFSYNIYGQVNKISQVAADNHQLNYVSYNLPNDTTTQTDCPRFTERRDYAQDWNSGSEAVTSFSISTSQAWTTLASGSDSGTLTQVTTPDGTIYKTYSHSSGWDKGFPRLTETWVSTTKQRWVFSDWDQDDTGLGYIKNPRSTHTHILDTSSNHKHTEVQYTTVSGTGYSYVMPSDTIEYDSNATTPARKTHTDYTTVTYQNGRVGALPSAQYLYGYDTSSSSYVLASHTGFSYDDSGMLYGQTGAVHHDDTNFGTSVARGNLTKVLRYDINSSSHLDAQTKYYTTGTVYKVIDPLSHTTTFDYADLFSASTNHSTFSTFAYPTTVTNADSQDTTTTYNYDFGAVTKTHNPQGAEMLMTYDTMGRVTQQTAHDHSSGHDADVTYTRYVYPTSQTLLESYTLVSGSSEMYSFSILDGAGRVRGTASDFLNTSGVGYRGQYMIYDVMGRLIQQSKPTEMTSSWAAAGDDSGGWVYTSQTYDWKGRPLSTTNTDSTTKSLSYGGCGCAGGEVTTSTDEVGRKQVVTADILGRVKQLDLYSNSTTIYSSTVNKYNARDQILTSDVHQGISSSTSYQTTTTTYDGYGRLATKQLPIYVADGNSISYTYNDDDSLNVMTDPRKATATYSYYTGGRVKGIHFDTPSASGSDYSAIDSNSANPDVSYAYDSVGNVVNSYEGTATAIAANAWGEVDYTYDLWGKLISETRKFADLAGHGPNSNGTYTIGYQYNLAGQLTRVTDPNGNYVNYGYDTSEQLTGITDSGYSDLGDPVTTLASNIKHRAWGALKSVSYGNSFNMSTSFNSRMLPSHFQVTGTVSGSTFTVMSSDYTYDYDGKINFASEIFGNQTTDHKFDRAYSYDSVGRLGEAYTGAQATTHSSSTEDGPYRQSYGYDVWGNANSRTNRFWNNSGSSLSFSYTYANDRNQNSSWHYDHAGNLKQNGNQTFKFDAAGHKTNSDAISGVIENTIDESMDASGQYIKRHTHVTDSSDSGNNSEETGYVVRSTVLGGQKLADVGSSGSIGTVYLYYPNGELLAESNGIVRWLHTNPITGTQAKIRTSLNDIYLPTMWVLGHEYDPAGASIGFTNPYTAYGSPDLLDVNKNPYIDGGDPFDYSGGCSDGNGMPASCSFNSGQTNEGAIGMAEYEGRVNTVFSKNLAEYWWNHGHRDWAEDIVANSHDQIGIEYRITGFGYSETQTDTLWGAEAASFLDHLSGAIDRGSQDAAYPEPPPGASGGGAEEAKPPCLTIRNLVKTPGTIDYMNRIWDKSVDSRNEHAFDAFLNVLSKAGDVYEQPIWRPGVGISMPNYYSDHNVLVYDVAKMNDAKHQYVFVATFHAHWNGNPVPSESFGDTDALSGIIKDNGGKLALGVAVYGLGKYTVYGPHGALAEDSKLWDACLGVDKAP